MTYPFHDAPRPCVLCGAHTHYDIYVKSAYNIPKPHCLLCSIELEEKAKDAISNKTHATR